MVFYSQTIPCAFPKKSNGLLYSNSLVINFSELNSVKMMKDNRLFPFCQFTYMGMSFLALFSLQYRMQPRTHAVFTSCASFNLEQFSSLLWLTTLIFPKNTISGPFSNNPLFSSRNSFFQSLSLLKLYSGFTYGQLGLESRHVCQCQRC